MHEEAVVKTGLAGIIALWAYITNSLSVLYFIAIIIALMDYIAGFLAGWVNNEFDSAFGWRGAVRKVGILLLPAFALLIDYTTIVLAHYAGIDMPQQSLLYVLTCSYIIGLDGSSFLANLIRIGVPVPKFLTDRMAELQRKEERGQLLREGKHPSQKPPAVL